MSFSDTTVGATVECAGTISASAEGVSASVRAVCSLTGAVSASTEAAATSAGAVFGVFG